MHTLELKRDVLMNDKAMIGPPVAKSPRVLRREMLRANRFLGLHQAWWGLILAPILVLLAYLIVGDWQWWWVLSGYLAGWAAVEFCFLPRRVVIHRLAIEESRAAVVREAWKHGVALRDVKIMGRESVK